MHIPASDSTTELDILPFARALELAMVPKAEYDVEKWLFVPDFYTEYRYILGTRGSRPLICIGINPSTARPDALDNTLKSVERIALGNGFDSFIMFNVYPQRATDPDTMEAACNETLRRENLNAFERILSLSQEPTVWAAWGTIIEKRDYLAQCLRDLATAGQTHNARWVKAGKVSKKGHPHHPLYLSKTAPLEPFDLESYLDTLGRKKERTGL